MKTVLKTTPTRTRQMAPLVFKIPDGAIKNILLDEKTAGHVEYHVGKDAVLNVVHIISNDSSQNASTENRALVSQNGEVNFWHIFFAGVTESLKNEFKTETFLNGEGARTNHRTIFLGCNSAAFSLSVSNVHNAPNTISRMESKGIVKDKARVKYAGLVKMTKNARGADGSLNQKALMLSNTSLVEAVPSLEIDTNDVRASHSASTTRVDEEQLFYAASRGISERAATLMIADGFLRPHISTIPDKNIQEKLFNMIPTLLQ